MQQRRFIPALILTLLLALTAAGEWNLTPNMSTDYPIAVMTPGERVMVFTDVLGGTGHITPWVLAYELVDGEPDVLYSHFYTDLLTDYGTPAMVRITSDRCYVLTFHSQPEWNWEMYAVNFDGETLWHNVVASESDPDFNLSMREHAMVASEEGVIILWEDPTHPSAWTGHWYSPEGEEVRELGPYENPAFLNRFILDPYEDGFLLLHFNSGTVIGQEQDSSFTTDIGYSLKGSKRVDQSIWFMEFESAEDIILVRRFDLDCLAVTISDTIASEWCSSVRWSERSLVYNKWEECFYQRLGPDGVIGAPIHYYESLLNSQLIVPFGEDDADWIMQRDNLDCEIFFGYPDSVVWRYQAGIETTRPIFALPDSERIHLIWQRSGINLKLLPDELETVYHLPVPNTSVLEVYPNPFNGICSIKAHLEQTGSVSLAVYDLLGRRVASWSEMRTAGQQTFSWQPEQLSGGIYFISLLLPDGSLQQAKLLFLP